jgi:hypothetical protein
VDDSLKRGLTFVHNIVDSNNLSWADSIEEVPYHLLNLISDIPCGEVRRTSNPCGEASSLPAIVNAAWINELRSQNTRSDLSAEKGGEEYVKACRLLLKSVEDAHLKRTFAKEIAPALRSENH